MLKIFKILVLKLAFDRKKTFKVNKMIIRNRKVHELKDSLLVTDML
jgi:hypothetical protein